MIINTCAKAIAEALQQTRNTPGTCQLSTRGWYNSPSAGDVDGDGDSDAKDGWLSEPSKYRVIGDRNPPGGVPLYFSKNGGRGFGHRCMTLRDKGRLRSTDMLDNRYAPGRTSTVVANTTSDAIAIIERAMGVQFVGWSKSMDGNLIPDFMPKPVEYTRGRRVDQMLSMARRSLAKAKKGSPRYRLLRNVVKALLNVKQFPKK
jgi:hypothetical protein